jgi:hypothetical protein
VVDADRNALPSRDIQPYRPSSGRGPIGYALR